MLFICLPICYKYSYYEIPSYVPIDWTGEAMTGKQVSIESVLYVYDDSNHIQRTELFHCCNAVAVVVESYPCDDEAMHEAVLQITLENDIRIQHLYAAKIPAEKYLMFEELAEHRDTFPVYFAILMDQTICLKFIRCGNDRYALRKYDGPHNHP